MENENELSFEEKQKLKEEAWEVRQREFFKRLKHPRLRILVEAYYDFQKLRISEGNRLQMYDRFEMLNPLQSAKFQEIVNDLKRNEQRIVKLAQDELKNTPVWLSWLKHVKGIGPMMGAGLIAWIDDVGRFDTVSKLWQYSGFGKPGQKRTKGEKGNWNPRMRTHMWKVIKQMLMAKNQFYRGHYDEAKMKYLMRDDIKEMHKGKKGYKGHVDAMAKRKVAKLFLAHLWEMWRRAEGLEIRTPYVVEKFGHHIIPPPEFGGGDRG